MEADAITIRRMEARDATSLVHCFERCYRGSYPADAFHDPDRVERAITEETLRSVVAIAQDVGVVGHMGLSMRPGSLTAEAGNTVVDPNHRGAHLAARLALELTRLTRACGLIGFHHYPTTAHPVMQQLSVQGNGIEEGLLFDYIPAQTEYVGFEAPATNDRVAVLAVFEPVAAAPRRAVWLPDRHREWLRDFYVRAGFARDPIGPAGALPGVPSRLSTVVEDRRGLLRISLSACGADLCDRVLEAIAAAPGLPCLVDLPMSEPTVHAATEALARHDFCFAAVLPEYGASGDILRLQRPAGEPAKPQLATAGGRALFDYILEDIEAGNEFSSRSQR